MRIPLIFLTPSLSPQVLLVAGHRRRGRGTACVRVFVRPDPEQPSGHPGSQQRAIAYDFVDNRRGVCSQSVAGNERGGHSDAGHCEAVGVAAGTAAGVSGLVDAGAEEGLRDCVPGIGGRADSVVELGA